MRPGHGMKLLIATACALAISSPTFAAGAFAPYSLGRMPVAWVKVMAVVEKDIEKSGVDLRCHTLGVLPDQTVTRDGVHYENLFLVATGYDNEYYHASSDGRSLNYKCGRLYKYYIDENGKIIQKTETR